MRSQLERLMWAACVALLATGCADRSWQAARARDTVAAYSRFLRSDPESPHAEDARQRIDFLRVRKNKSLRTFEAFARNYPSSPWLGELRAEMEDLYFERARHINTSDAYRAFLASYPDGHSTARANGNLIYVSRVRPRITQGLLQAFIEEHPDSDFVEEARESLALIELSKSSQIRQMGVMVEVAPNIAQPQRVRKGFAAMVARKYQAMGVQVWPIARGASPSPQMDAWVRIGYEESQASGVFGGSTLLSRCRLRVYHRTQPEEPIWDRVFEAPAEHVLAGSHGRDKTVFGNSRYPFWDHFFVPVSTWATGEARIGRVRYLEDVAGLDVVGDRALVLFGRGGFDLLDISRPTKPQVLQRYRREHDLSRWSGIRLAGDMALLYGPDGAEVVEHLNQIPTKAARWEAPDIGAIRSAQIYGETALLAGNKGVYAIRIHQRPLKPHRLLEGDFVGIELSMPYIYLVRPERVEVTAPKHLLRHLTGSRVGVGEKFQAKRARLIQGDLYVFGDNKTIRFSLERPARPVLEAEFEGNVLGPINDMAADSERLYVLGDRGLQITAPDAQWVADSIQVTAGKQLIRRGQYLFLVGDRLLEVVDVGPYLVAEAPAPAAASQ